MSNGLKIAPTSDMAERSWEVASSNKACDITPGEPQRGDAPIEIRRRAGSTLPARVHHALGVTELAEGESVTLVAQPLPGHEGEKDPPLGWVPAP